MRILPWLLLLCVGCVNQKVARRADASRPPDETGTISLATLASSSTLSRSVFTQPRERDLMSRVLLSPNVVFESSRSSGAEPKTIGPRGGSDATPNLEDALGRPVEISLSTRLMEYLSGRGTLMLAPAITRRFSDYWWCSDVNKCPQATWVERLMMLYGLKRWNIDPEAKGREGPPPTNEPRPQDLATAALAVRELDLSVREATAVVELTGPAQYEIRLRRGPNDNPGVCGDVTVKVPMVNFQAELISMKDGRLLARINEARSPKTQVGALRRAVTVVSYVPESETDYTERDWQGVKVPQSEYRYIKRWVATRPLCETARGMIQTWQGAVYDALRSELGVTSVELFRTAFDPLYTTGRDTVVSAEPPAPPPMPLVPAMPTPQPPALEAPPPLPGQCSTSSDCKAGRVCIAGECVAAPTMPCTSNANCKGGKVCTQGRCVSP